MAEVRQLRFVTSDGTALAAYEAGQPKGPTLVLSNGLGGNIRAWRHFVEDFAPWHRVVSWDYRGLYRSEAPRDPTRYGVDVQTEDLRELLDFLEIDEAVLVGWSMGVQVNFEAWARFPERVSALVQINGTIGRPFHSAFGTDRLAPMVPMVTQVLEALAPSVQRYVAPVARTKTALEVLRLVGLVSDTLDETIFSELAAEVIMLDMKAYMTTLRALGDHDTEHILPTVKVPTLVIAGDRDPLTPIERSRKMTELVPDAELFVVPSGTHYTPIEFPELLHLRIEKFLRDRMGFTRT